MERKNPDCQFASLLGHIEVALSLRSHGYDNSVRLQGFYCTNWKIQQISWNVQIVQYIFVCPVYTCMSSIYLYIDPATLRKNEGHTLYSIYMYELRRQCNPGRKKG